MCRCSPAAHTCRVNGPDRDTRGNVVNLERYDQIWQSLRMPANPCQPYCSHPLALHHVRSHHPVEPEAVGYFRWCFPLPVPWMPFSTYPKSPQEGTNLCLAPLTHRSPVSRMLLRYLWQSWRTWGQNQEGCGMVGLAQSWASTRLPALKLGKGMDPAPYATLTLGEEVQTLQWQPKVGALQGEVSKMRGNRVLHSPMAWGRQLGQGRKPTLCTEGHHQEPSMPPCQQCRRDVSEGTLTLGWPSRRTLCRTWQNFQLRMALLGRGSPMA